MLPTPARRHDPEWMDAPGLPADEVAEAYRVLRRVNRQFFGGLRPILREARRLIDEDRPGPAPPSILDVGSGSGDLPAAIREDLGRSGIPTVVLALDRDPTAPGMASRSGLHAVRADALRLPFGDRSIDLVSATKFAHHFSGAALARLLSEMSRVARRRVVVLDIRRHWLAYYGFVAWSRVFTRNRLVRHDGPLSVLRGFTIEELTDLSSRFSDFDWSVRRYAGFQIALVGRRTSAPSADDLEASLDGPRADR
jgi:SAM-dependent methyltransferase